MERESISVEELRWALEHGHPVTVLDIRPGDERAEWWIPGSVHVDAYEALKAGDTTVLDEVDLPVDRTVVTVCAAGHTARVAAAYLRTRGLEVASLDGGMKRWSLAWNSATVPVLDSLANVLQVRRTGKGCLSYLIGSEQQAMVIDASLEPDVYQHLAAARGWTITKVLETHVHADHVSRARQLAYLTGATLFLPAQDRVAFPFTPLQDGDTVSLGDATVVVLSTPGHTPESVSYLLDDSALFTGDTLFPQSVGRPDLEADAEGAVHRARLLYRSLQRIRLLPPTTLILPGHVSQPIPFDGTPIVSTLEEVVEAVAMVTWPQDRFADHVLSRVPPTPPNHHVIVALNEAGVRPEGDVTDLEAGANRCAVA